MSRPAHFSRPSHSAAGSVSFKTEAPAATTWTPSTIPYSTTSSLNDVIAPLCASPPEPASGRSRAKTLSGRTGHRRTSSALSVSSTPNDPFPGFEDPAESVVAPLPGPHVEMAAPRSASMSSGGRMKMRHRSRTGSRGTGSLDLSKSRAENEDMGVYTSLDGYGQGLYSPSVPGHQRTASQISVSSDLNSRLGGSALFIHPMRQTPQSFTPPIIHAWNLSSPATDNEEEENSMKTGTFSPNTLYSPPSLPRSSYRRPSITGLTIASSQSESRSASRSASQSNLKLASPADSARSPSVFSPTGTPLTERSSFDSMVFRKKAPMDEEEFAATVQQLRLEYAEKQRAKEAKIAAKEAKAREKQLRKKEARERKTMSRRGSKQDENISGPGSSDDEEEASIHHTYAFPLFEPVEQPADPPSAPRESSDHSIHTHDSRSSDLPDPPDSPEPRGPPLQRAVRSASNKWSKIIFDATTFRIHVMRSMGLRSRD